jgi:hypothetical protein
MSRQAWVGASGKRCSKRQARSQAATRRWTRPDGVTGSLLTNTRPFILLVADELMQPPLRVYPPDINIWRAVEPAAWVRSDVGIPTKRAAAPGKEQEPERRQRNRPHRPCWQRGNGPREPGPSRRPRPLFSTLPSSVNWRWRSLRSAMRSKRVRCRWYASTRR